MESMNVPFQHPSLRSDVMDNQLFLEIASRYMDDKELDGLRKMIYDRKGYILSQLPPEDIAFFPQFVQGTVEVCSRISPDSGTPLVTAKLKNRGKEAIASLIIRLGGDEFKRTTVNIPPHKDFEIRYTLDDLDLNSAFPCGRKIHCIVSLEDQYSRELTRSEKDVVVVRDELSRLVSVDLRELALDKPGIIPIAIAHLESHDNVPVSLTITILDGDMNLLTMDTVVEPDEVVDLPLFISRNNIPYGHGRRLLVRISSQSGILSEVPFYVDNESSTSTEFINIDASSKDIFADCKLLDTIDVHEQSDDGVLIGTMAAINKGCDDEKVRATLSVDGSVVINTVMVLPPNKVGQIPLSVPPNALYSEEPHTADVRIGLTDSEGHSIMDRVMTLDVMSIYDLDLRKIIVRTARFTNPHDRTLRTFVDDHNGPLARAMGNEYCIQGYQQPDKIMPQLEGIWNAVKNQGMSYVSDTNTIGNGFQRVRMPSKILEDHTGNCIELSILFASFLEIMGFEPVVIFPPGHAIIGIVTGTDVYRSDSKYPSDKWSGDHILRFHVDNGHGFDALFFESTMCSNRNASIKDAIASARDTLVQHKHHIESKNGFSLISKLHNEGIKPILR